jgi:hypothetical protein
VNTKSPIVQISPNPTHETIFTGPDWHIVTILDVTGKEIKRLTVNVPSQTLDVSYLPSGPYYLIIGMKDGKRKVGRLVKL